MKYSRMRWNAIIIWWNILECDEIFSNVMKCNKKVMKYSRMWWNEIRMWWNILECDEIF
jgi:hypothetical protein